MHLEDDPSIERNPESPIEGQSEKLRAGRVPFSDIEDALRQGYYPFGSRPHLSLRPRLRERFEGDRDVFLASLVKNLEESGITIDAGKLEVLNRAFDKAVTQIVEDNQPSGTDEAPVDK